MTATTFCCLFFAIILFSGCSTYQDREARRDNYFNCVKFAEFDPKSKTCEQDVWKF